MRTAPRDRVTGLILAGGLARRMDGREKGLLQLGGRPLLAHVLERLTPQVATLLISANRQREAYAAFGHPVVADVVGDFAGPLAGLHAGLKACATPFLATVPCDAPLLPLDLVARLVGALEADDAAIAAAFAAGRLQPAFMLCRREVLGDLEPYIAGGGRRIHEWLVGMGAREVRFEDADAFANINTPAELERMEGGYGMRTT
ncbi:MAG: molybdenum cofactor guanylyltransferase [Rhodocyclales bacterium]|nr:molybdenum cofactor guanylyltransferase [Rhodocyclales bacterium]